MKFLKDWEYFHDVDVNGRLKEESDSSISRGAAWKFMRTVFAEQLREVSFEASSYLAFSKEEAKNQVEIRLRNQIKQKEKAVWHECIRSFIKENPDRIGDFPQEEYHLHTLRSKKDAEETYEVRLNCPQLIREYQSPLLKVLSIDKEEFNKMDRQRRNLQLAAFLTVIHFLLNAATLLSFLPEYSFLYLGSADPIKWSVFVAGMLLVARLCHFSKTTWYGLGIFMVAGTFGMQGLSPEMRATEFEGYSMISFMVFCGITVLASLICMIRFIIDASKAPRTNEQWRSWVSCVDTDAVLAHKEIRFLALWYRHMTGKTCDNLKSQERQLRKYVAYANKKRRR